MTQQMQCLEVWGGNRAVEHHSRMPGLEVWLYSQPYDDASSGGNNFGTVFYNGYYCEALYFLTGEHRVYEKDRGAFGRVAPNENAYLVRGTRGWCFCRGAWQLGVRYSHLDLNDSGVNGGVVQDATLGLNWFLNPNFKLQWNYVYTDRDAPGAAEGGHNHGFGMRVAHDF